MTMTRPDTPHHTLFLMRHAKTEGYNELGDKARGLTSRGRDQAGDAGLELAVGAHRERAQQHLRWPSVADAEGRVTVIVEMEGDPVAVVEAEQGRSLSPEERGDLAARLEQAQASVVGAIADAGGDVQAQMQSAFHLSLIHISEPTRPY